MFSSDQKSWEDLKNFHFNHPTFPYLKMALQRGSKMSKLDCAIPSIELESHKHVIYRESPFSTIKIERNHKIETKMHNKWRNQKIIWFWPHCCKSKFLKEFQDIYFIFVSQVFNHIPSSAEKCRAASFKNRGHS